MGDPNNGVNTSYKVGDDVKAWSKTFEVWGLGKVIKVEGGTVTINFTMPDGQLYTKEFPAGHPHLQILTVADDYYAPAGPAGPAGVSARGGSRAGGSPAAARAMSPQVGHQVGAAPGGAAWSIGDAAKVWSRSRQMWGLGHVERLDGDLVYVRFDLPEGDGKWGSYTKGLPPLSQELRRGSAPPSNAPPVLPQAASPMAAPQPVQIPVPPALSALPRYGTMRWEDLPLRQASPQPQRGAQRGSSRSLEPVRPPPATPTVAPPPGTAGGLVVDELQVQGTCFDLLHPAIQPQLVRKLGVSANASIKGMPNPGGRNAGMWVLQDGQQSLVLKLVKPARVAPQMPTETERLLRLAQEHRGIVNDAALTFPSRILHVVINGTPTHDLYVMRKAPGTRLTDLMAVKLSKKQGKEVMQWLELLGAFLADFHSRYGGKQHGDFQPSNIMYDEAARTFTLVDVADIGPPSSHGESDVDHFNASLRLLSTSYGHQFFMDGSRAFTAGYQQHAARLGVPTPPVPQGGARSRSCSQLPARSTSCFRANSGSVMYDQHPRSTSRLRQRQPTM